MVQATALSNILSSELASYGYDLKYLSPGASPAAYAAYMQSKNFLKKFAEHDRIPEKLQSKAILGFLESMDRCSKWELDIPDLIMDVLHNEVRRLLWSFWNVADPWIGFSPLIDSPHDLWPHLRPGPGASIAAVDNDFYTKLFASPLSATSARLPLWYNKIVTKYPLWSEAENFRRIVHGLDDIIVKGSHLSVVPKNNETGRCICTEPSINMLFQLSIGTLLERRLDQTYGIRLDIQPLRNQALARMGSLNGFYATIDLKSASDSISLRLLESLLPLDFLRMLKFCRSEEVRIPGLGFRTLPMVSTMGNGYTFPLQTILFTCIVHAAYILHDIPLARGRNANFGVFGDDIIVDVKVVRTLYRALAMYGFIVNEDKSFYEGPFRESCGADFYRGFNTRAFYLKRLSLPSDYYVAINGLLKWSARTGIFLPRTTRWLLARCKWLPVPRWESDDAGIKVPYSLVAKHLRFCKFTQSPLYRYFSTKPRSVKVEGTLENSAGALIALLAGNIRNGCITRRSLRQNYTLKWNCAPGWDNSGDLTQGVSEFWDQRWNTAAVFNLYG